MIIVISGSLRFADQILALEHELITMGHKVLAPEKIPGVVYGTVDGIDAGPRIEAKIRLNLIREHMQKIEQSDAMLAANYDHDGIPGRIGANTFAEMIYAFHLGKPIYLLNPLPNQPYIIEELLAMNPIILTNYLSQLGTSM